MGTDGVRPDGGGEAGAQSAGGFTMLSYPLTVGLGTGLALLLLPG